MIYNRLSYRRILVGTLLLVGYSYIGVLLGSNWRLIENLIVAVVAFYCTYRLVISGNTFIVWAMACACIATALSGLNEGIIYYYTRNDWIREMVAIPVTGEWYSFGNHFRNLPLIIMMLALSGALQELLAWLSKVINDEQ